MTYNFTNLKISIMRYSPSHWCTCLSNDMISNLAGTFVIYTYLFRNCALAICSIRCPHGKMICTCLLKFPCNNFLKKMLDQCRLRLVKWQSRTLIDNKKRFNFKFNKSRDFIKSVTLWHWVWSHISVPAWAMGTVSLSTISWLGYIIK